MWPKLQQVSFDQESNQKVRGCEHCLHFNDGKVYRDLGTGSLPTSLQ